MYSWPDLTFPPLNLWNFRNWRYGMSGGIEEMYREERMGLKEALEKGLKTIAPYSTHYRALNPEPINVIEGWGLGFNLGNAIKYIARAEYKGSKEADLEKAIWYLQRELLK